jgi:plasmid stabilization system protein ParE
MKLTVAAKVLRQIDEQLLFIANHSITNALAWEVRLRGAMDRIPASTVHSLDHDASTRVGYSVYKLLFERTYYVHYVIDPTESLIEIVSFRHGARMPGPDEP